MTRLHAIDHRLQSAPDVAAFRFELIFTLIRGDAELTNGTRSGPRANHQARNLNLPVPRWHSSLRCSCWRTLCRQLEADRMQSLSDANRFMCVHMLTESRKLRFVLARPNSGLLRRRRCPGLGRCLSLGCRRGRGRDLDIITSLTSVIPFSF